MTLHPTRTDHVAATQLRPSMSVENGMRTLGRRRRGLLVILTWIVWLPLYPTAEMLLRLMFGTSRRCSIEGCSSLEGWAGLVSDALWFGPPLLVTVLWIRERRRQRTAEPGA